MLVERATIRECDWMFRRDLERRGRIVDYRKKFHAITQVELQKVITNGANPGVFTGTLGTATTAEELIVLSVITGSVNVLAPASVTDNLGQTYTLSAVSGAVFPTHFWSGIYYKENSAAGVTTITVTEQSGDTAGGMFFGHYKGIATSGALDKTSGALASVGNSPWASPSIYTSVAHELLVGSCFGNLLTGVQVVLLPSGNWTQDATLRSDVDGGSFEGNNGNSGAYAHQIIYRQNAGGYANTGTDTNVGNVNHYPGVVSFFAAAQRLTRRPSRPL